MGAGRESVSAMRHRPGVTKAGFPLPWQAVGGIRMPMLFGGLLYAGMSELMNLQNLVQGGASLGGMGHNV